MNEIDKEKQKEFYKIFNTQIKKNNRKNFNREKLNEYINICKKKIAQNAREYYILKKYDIRYNNNNDNDDKKEMVLINNNNNNNNSTTTSLPPPIYIALDDIYNYIKIAHDRTLHSGIKKTYSEVRKMVNNVKIKHVKIYVSLCFYCQNIKNKNKRNKEGIRIKSPIISKRFNQRAQIDLIDIKCLGMGDWRYVLNYQDNLTKFCILKPLSDKKNIVPLIMEIFNLFGAPKILHSDNGGEFRGKQFLEYFKRFWPEITLVRGKPYNPRSQGSVERANGHVKNMILACIHNNNVFNYDLRNILLYVQYVKNTTYNRTIKCTPYKALFGQDIIVEQKIENIFQQYMNNDDDDDDDSDNNNDTDSNNKDDDNIDNNNNLDIINRTQDIEFYRNNVFTNIKQAAENLITTTNKYSSNI